MNNFMIVMGVLNWIFWKWAFWAILLMFVGTMIVEGVQKEEKKMGIAKTVDGSSSNDADSTDYHSYSWDDDDDDYYD